MENELQLTDLIDVEILQKIQDAFSDMTGIASVTTDANGVAVTKGSHFSDFCMKYTRTSPIGCQRCEQCDKHGAEIALERGTSSTYFCHAGLMDFAAPIIANGEMIGCFIGGQVLTQSPDITKILKVAEEIDVNPIHYIQAVMKVNIVEKETIDRAADFLYTIANILSNIAYHKYQVLQANMEIEKATRIKSDFLANMSHEIRTPMNAVIGMAEMALREELPPAARDYITQIKASGKTLLTIINDILDFSKIESGKMDIIPSEYEPLSIIHDIASIIATRIESKDVELILDISPDIPYKLLGDSIRFKQVLLNLANNAVKFTKNGRVLLRIESVPISEDEIEIQAAIEDTGIGIKKEHIGRLFRSFEQLDSKRNRNIEGTGLGLAISKQLLTLMNGTIAVESEYGVGSIFSFTLPQKVIKNLPSIVLRSAKPVTAAGLIQNPFISEQLQKDLERFHATYIPLHDITALALASDTPIQYLFIEHAVFSKQAETYVRNHPELTAVLIVDFHTSIDYRLANLKIIKKPLYAFNLAALLNHDDFHINRSDDAEDNFEFIAPEAKILIVDDNAINLTVTEGLLEPLKMQIDTALSGEEAIGKISVKHYDLIFMDHMMPDLDGIETTHIIRRFHSEYYNVPIIALTANAIDGTKELFLKEGMNDFVAKPIELRLLILKLKYWLPKDKIQKLYETADTPTDSSAPMVAIEGLDTNAALKLVGSKKLFWAVLKDYYQVIKKKANLIKTYETQENWSAYTVEVHALKSASKQVGADDLSEKAAAMEKAGNEENAALIHAQTDELLQQYLNYHTILKPFFQNAPEPLIQAAILPEVLQQCFIKMKAALENLDSDEMETVLNEMNQHTYPPEQAELLKQLNEAVEEIDVDSCAEVLNTWEKLL